MTGNMNERVNTWSAMHASGYADLLDPGTGRVLDPERPHDMLRADASLMDGLRYLATREAITATVILADESDPDSLGEDFEKQVANADVFAYAGEGWKKDDVTYRYGMAQQGEAPNTTDGRIDRALHGRGRRIAFPHDWHGEADTDRYRLDEELAQLHQEQTILSQFPNSNAYMRHRVAYESLREWRQVAHLGHMAALYGRTDKPIDICMTVPPEGRDVVRKFSLLGVDVMLVDKVREREMNLFTAMIPEMVRRGRVPLQALQGSIATYDRFVQNGPRFGS